MFRRLTFAILLLCVTGCSEKTDPNPAQEMIAEIDPTLSDDSAYSAPVNKFGFMEAMEQGPDPFGQSGPTGRDMILAAEQRSETATGVREPSAKLVAPKSMIAYAYAFGFAIDQENIPDLQQAHAAICEALGANCRILRMAQAGTDSYDGYGELELQVEASKARAFGNSLRKPAEDLGGVQVSFVVDGEDLSETIIDTEARLASRQVLRDKLTDILRSNRGSVDELVKAEKAVAEVNEEIDSTRSKLGKLRNRIDFSTISINYSPTYGETQIGFVRPIVTAFKSIGSTLGMTIGALVYLATVLVPIMLFLLALRWTLHRFGLRIRFWRKREQTG